MPIQQMLLGVGAATKTYVDDLFSNYLYTGNASDKTITNGIDLAGEGGLVWIKRRSGASDHALVDTVRGASQYLSSNSTAGNVATGANNNFNSFTSTGFTLKDDNGNDFFNKNNATYQSWSFRKAPGFLDIQEYSSGSSNTSGSIGNPNFQVNHDLGCVPGMILIKRTNGSAGWYTWVRGKEGGLDSTGTLGNAQALPLADVTSTYFKFAQGNGAYNDPQNYIAYIFAGGESDAATARSVDFDGSNDGLTVPNSSDFSFGSGDFTVEGWAKIDQNSVQNALIGVWRYQDDRRSWTIQTDNSTRKLEFFVNSGGGTGTNHATSGGNVPVGQWFHFAGVRHGNTIKLFVNGELVASTSYSASLYNNTNDPLVIGNQAFGTDYTDGKISNIRVTKGQALYTSSFIVTTEPLTTTSQGATASNVKLLCCNSSSVTGSTVTPTTISNSGSTASTDSPFDDPAGFSFGDSGDQNVIKTGSYVGSGTAGLEVNVGFEPQFIIFKSASGTWNWYMLDVMRGIVSNGDEAILSANTNSAEFDSSYIDVTPTGFKVQTSHALANASGDTYMYMCLRRPDGYVGKPADAATNIFAIDTGNGSSTIPTFDSGFPVDFAFVRPIHITTNWGTYSRLTGEKFLRLNTKDAQGNYAGGQWDSNAGFGAESYWDSNSVAWMWQRGISMDTVTFKGDGVQGRDIRHNLGVSPDMMWVKNRTRTLGGGSNWIAYVSGITHLSVYGSDPDNYGNNPVAFELDNTAKAQFSGSGYWDHTHPTSTHFRVGDTYHCNQNGEDMIAFLFASRSGISKVGSYSGSNSDQTITLGFQPRFFLCKSSNTEGTGFSWNVFDSTRGISGSSTKRMFLDQDVAQQSGSYVTSVSSTGITLAGDFSHSNQASRNYIYYAHA